MVGLIFMWYNNKEMSNKVRLRRRKTIVETTSVDVMERDTKSLSAIDVENDLGVFSKLTSPQLTFLEAYLDQKDIAHACKKAEVHSVRNLYENWMKNPVFYEAYVLVREAITDALEDKAVRVALHGNVKMLSFLLRGRRRGIYGDQRVNISARQFNNFPSLVSMAKDWLEQPPAVGAMALVPPAQNFSEENDEDSPNDNPDE